jgi:tRNA (guanine37-N1)-methyltransferase
MLRIDIITLFPEIFSALDSGITGRAIKSGLIELHCHNPRDYSADKTGRVDDRPFGGGPGMVMCIQPIQDTVKHIKENIGSSGPVILLSPQGAPLQQDAVNLSAQQYSQIILICGRYEGIDERCMAFIDQEISIGDFVLSGGELPAMCYIDSVIRQLPGALGDAESALADSFMQHRLDHPHYTRPAEHALGNAPAVLLSGDHDKIKYWRQAQALKKTCCARPDMVKKHPLTLEEQKLQSTLGKFKQTD